MKIFGKATTDFVPNPASGKSSKDLATERREAAADLRKRSVNHNDTSDERARLNNARKATGELN